MKVIFALGALLITLPAVLLALPFLVDLNPYVARYKPQIEEALHRTVELKDIRLTIWPRLGARVDGFAILDDPKFGASPFASFTSLDVGVRLWPLLRGHVEVEEISLRDPVITVIKDRQGVLNVSTIGGREPGEAEVPGVQPTVPEAEGGPLRALALLAVNHVMLTNGQLTYRDLSTTPKPTEYMVQNLEVRLADVQLGRTPTVSLRGLLQPLNLPVTVDGLLGPLKASGELERLNIKLGLGQTLVALDGSVQGGHASVNLTSPAINSVDVPVPLPLTKPVLVKNLRAHVDVPYPIPAGASSLDVAAVRPVELEMVMGDSTIAVKGSLVNKRAKVLVTASAVGTGDVPLALPLTKPVMIKGLKIEAEVPVPLKDGVSALDQMVVQPLELTAVIGRSTVSVHGRAVGGELRLEVTAPVVHTTDLPVTITALKRSIELKNLRMAAQVKGNRARVTELSLGVFDGQVKGEAGGTLYVTPMPFEGTLAMKGIQIGPLMEALGHEILKVRGTTAADVAVRGRGLTIPELTQALEGTAHMRVTNGTVDGIDLAHEVVALLQVVGVSPDAVNATVFSTLEADFSVRCGVATVKRLVLDSREVQAQVRGTIGFDQALDLKADVALSQTLSWKAASSPVAKLVMSGGRVSVPILIGGTLQSPTYALDAKGVGGKVQEKIQEKLEEQLQQQADKLLKGKSGEAVQKGTDALKRLFGR